jgi:hypothetical protein
MARTLGWTKFCLMAAFILPTSSDVTCGTFDSCLVVHGTSCHVVSVWCGVVVGKEGRGGSNG